MAKTKQTYIATVGFDIDEGRFEKGDVVDAGKIAPATVKQLLKDGDIEITEAK